MQIETKKNIRTSGIGRIFFLSFKGGVLQLDAGCDDGGGGTSSKKGVTFKDTR